MRRPMVLFVTAVMLFALAVGLVTASLLLDPLPASRSAITGLPERNAAIVRQFYDAANDAIATGNVEGVHTVVALHFVEHDALNAPTMQPGRDGLDAYLATLHAMSSDMQVVAETMVADDKRVMARVAVQGLKVSALPSGTAFGQFIPWGPVDVFRVSGGMIVERWSHTDGIALIQPLAEESLELPVPSPRIMTMKRLRIAAGDRWISSAAAGPRLLYLEDGALHVEITSPRLTAGTAEARGTAVEPGWALPRNVTLSVGRSLVMSPGNRMEATNSGAHVAQALVVTFDVPRSPGGAPPEPELSSPSVVEKLLAGGLATDVPIGSAVLALQRITLARNAWVSLTGEDGPTLLAVEAGRLGVAARGMVWLRRGADGMSASAGEALLGQGDGLLLHPDSLAMLHEADDDPAVALVLTLRPGPVPEPVTPAPYLSRPVS